LARGERRGADRGVLGRDRARRFGRARSVAARRAGRAVGALPVVRERGGPVPELPVGRALARGGLPGVLSRTRRSAPVRADGARALERLPVARALVARAPDVALGRG